MNCQRARELSSDYLDRRLSNAEVSFFEEHLNTCSACRRELEALRHTVSLIGSLDKIEPSSDFLRRVHEKIEKGKRGKRICAWLFEPLKVKVPLEATALILVSVTAFYLYQKLPELSRQEPIFNALKDAELAKEKPQAEIVGGLAGSLESYRAAESDSGGKLTGEESHAEVSRAPSFEARDEVVASAPQAEIREIVVANVADYEHRVKTLLEKVQGRLLAQADTSESGSLLTVEIPQSKQSEFLTALREEVQGVPEIAKLQQFARDSKKSVPKKGATGVGQAGEAASEPSPSSRLRSDEPMVTLQIRILPGK